MCHYFFREQLIAFRSATGHRPHRIIFYRYIYIYFFFWIMQNWICSLYLSDLVLFYSQRWCWWRPIQSSSALWDGCNKKGIIAQESLYWGAIMYQIGICPEYKDKKDSKSTWLDCWILVFCCLYVDTLVSNFITVSFRPVSH